MDIHDAGRLASRVWATLVRLNILKRAAGSSVGCTGELMVLAPGLHKSIAFNGVGCSSCLGLGSSRDRSSGVGVHAYLRFKLGTLEMEVRPKAILQWLNMQPKPLWTRKRIWLKLGLHWSPASARIWRFFQIRQKSGSGQNSAGAGCCCQMLKMRTSNANSISRTKIHGVSHRSLFCLHSTDV